MAFFQAMPWHEGEDKIHAITKVPPSDNPTMPMLSQNAAYRVAASLTIALGTVDSEGRVWCTLWGGGPRPIAQPVARGVIGIRTKVDASFDPVVEVLYGGKTDGEVIQHKPKDGKMVSGVSMNLEARDRVKLFGRMVAGSLAGQDSQLDSTSDTTSESKTAKGQKGQTGEAQLVLHITQSLGNCPKYINKKIVKAHDESVPILASDSPVLTPEAIAHVQSADTIFVASRGPEDMDCNHRGGLPGFVRVMPQDSATTSSVLVWPEYSGNNLYQTLGNIMANPAIGLVIPNLITGNVLYVSGKAEILVDSAATSVIQKTKLAVQLTITAARFVLGGLTFRGLPPTSNSDTSSSNPVATRNITDGMSPYNPRIRYLTTELTNPAAFDSGLPPDEWRARNSASVSATLIKKIQLTPTIFKYRFRLTSPNPQLLDASKGALWQPGQYIALDFSDELYMGYSHMRDDNPQALNDDFIRTFTVASRFQNGGKREPEFDVVIRNVGTATKWLSYQNDRSDITHVNVLGFGGEFSFATPVQQRHTNGDDGSRKPKQKKNVFVAAGIGITPLLGQLGTDGESSATDDLVLFWTVHISDIGLVEDVLASCPAQLRANTRIFVTGTGAEAEDSEDLRRLERLGGRDPQDAAIERRRLTREDLLAVEEREDVDIENWYFCTSPKMQKDLLAWLDGRSVLYEKFDY